MLMFNGEYYFSMKETKNSDYIPRNKTETGLITRCVKDLEVIMMTVDLSPLENTTKEQLYL